ncbi:MAG: PAS domain S-box protein, partial [Deltaproteobacteria bacterium]
MNSSDKLSEERYRAFIENVHDGVYETDVHGNFTYFNNSLCRVFGYPREEIQFHNYREFMDNQNARKAYDAFTRVFVTRKGFSDIIWEIIDKDGQKRFIELSSNLVTNKAGKKLGFRGIARDVTERFRMLEALKESEYRYQCQYEISREAERQYRTLLDFVPYPMVVFRLDGKVTYLNPAFTEIFGWNLGELQGKKIPYVPPGLEQETSKIIEKLLRDKSVMRYETKRLTKDGRVLDVVLRGAIFSSDGDEQGGQLVLLRDITREKRMARTNETLLRISMALPAYPVLEDLLDYISSEIKELLNTEGALVILLDEERNELFFKGAAYDDITKEERIKEIRFPADRGVSGRVLKTGEPIIVLDTAENPDFYPVVDEQLQFHTRNLLDVPLRSGDRIIGVLMALNKKEGVFEQTDVELLSMIGGTLALSIENARVSKALKEAYGEVTSLNRAKDKVINHLSHELKTPISVLSASLSILSKKLATQSDETWKPTIERAQRNLQRLLEIQYQVADIMRDKEYKAYERLSSVLDRTADELEALIAEEVGEVGVMERVRKRIEETFGPKETV